MVKERRAFEDFTEEEKEKVIEEGKKVYMQLYNTFSEGERGKDLFLNTLIYMLVGFIDMMVAKDDQREFLQLIHKILMKNLEKDV